MGSDLLGLLSRDGALVEGQSSADGAGLLGAEVEGEVLLALVELAEVLAGLLVDDGENAGDRLADNRAVVESKALGQPRLSLQRIHAGRA